MEYIHYLIDFVLHVDVHLAALVAQYGIWVYAILFVIVFCETGLVVTPFLPGDSLLFVAGALAALPTNGLNVHLLALAMAFAAVLGDASNYEIGRLFGTRLFRSPNSKIFKQSYLEKTHVYAPPAHREPLKTAPGRRPRKPQAARAPRAPANRIFVRKHDITKI